MRDLDSLLRLCRELETKSNKLYDESVEHLDNGNELEWENCLTESIKYEYKAVGIRYALKHLGLTKE